MPWSSPVRALGGHQVSAASGNSQAPSNHSGPTSTPRNGPPVAVAWTDAADERRGWVGTYVATGARIRNLPPSLKAEVERDLGNAWIAYTDLASYEPADEDTQRVLAMLTKILQRIQQGGIDALWIKETDRLCRPENLGDLSLISKTLEAAGVAAPKSGH